MLSQSFEVLSWTAVPIGKAAPSYEKARYKMPHNSARDYSARVAAIARRSGEIASSCRVGGDLKARDDLYHSAVTKAVFGLLFRGRKAARAVRRQTQWR